MAYSGGWRDDIRECDHMLLIWIKPANDRRSSLTTIKGLADRGR